MDMLGAPKDVVENKTMNEIWDIILGIPFGGDTMIKNRLLRDLDKLDDATFKPFYSKFKVKAEKFTELLSMIRCLKLQVRDFIGFH